MAVLVYVFRTRTNIVNGISSAVSTEVACVTLGKGRVLDLKFLYDDSLLVLWSLEGMPTQSIPLSLVNLGVGFMC